MWRNSFIILNWVIIVYGKYNYGDLDNLGERITAQVRAQVAPLEGLSERITAQVNRDLRPVQVREKRLVNLQNSLAGLEGLGSRITASVEQGLEPVRAIELNFKMRDGVGGTTIATHYPSGRKFIIKNYDLYVCSGQIDDNTGRCNGNLNLFDIGENSPKSDWCFVRSYIVVNDQICLSLGPTSVRVANNFVSCRSPSDEPVLLVPVRDYRRMCEGTSRRIEFKYLADEDDPRHVEIPNRNVHVKCRNGRQQKGVCLFDEDNAVLQHNGGNTVIVSNGGGVIYN